MLHGMALPLQSRLTKSASTGDCVVSHQARLANLLSFVKAAHARNTYGTFQYNPEGLACCQSAVQAFTCCLSFTCMCICLFVGVLLVLYMCLYCRWVCSAVHFLFCCILVLSVRCFQLVYKFFFHFLLSFCYFRLT